MIIFIDINIGSFDILNDIFGLIIVLYGLSKLKEISIDFSKALIFAQINIAWQILLTILRFSLLLNRSEIMMLTTGIDITVNILLIYYILSGLEGMAEDQNLDNLQSSLRYGSVFYILFIIITAVTGLISPIAIIFMVLSFFFYIYILILIRRSYNSIDQTYYKDISGKPTAMLNNIKTLLLVVLMPIIFGLGAIILSETYNIEIVPFNKNDAMHDQKSIDAIRANLSDSGFEKNELEILPDSEILKYQDIQKVQINRSQEIDCDGGILVISQYVSNYDLINYRYTIFYRWAKKPKFAHAETIGIVMNNKGIKNLNQTGFSSGNLFDIKGKDGKIQTFGAKDISNSQNNLHIAKKFKLANMSSAYNYRGYFASNIQIAANNNPWQYTNSFYYIHQSSIFNNRKTDILNFNNNKESFSSEEEDYFFKEYDRIALIKIGEG
ncbi:MAG: hypothetical protein ACYCYI_06490 [Saccharofermentanales bacterium]